MYSKKEQKKVLFQKVFVVYAYILHYFLFFFNIEYVKINSFMLIVTRDRTSVIRMYLFIKNPEFSIK